MLDITDILIFCCIKSKVMEGRFELDTAIVFGELDCFSESSANLLWTSPLLLVSLLQMEFRLISPMLPLSSLPV